MPAGAASVSVLGDSGGRGGGAIGDGAGALPGSDRGGDPFPFPSQAVVGLAGVVAAAGSLVWTGAEGL